MGSRGETKDRGGKRRKEGGGKGEDSEGEGHLGCWGIGAPVGDRGVILSVHVGASCCNHFSV